jgi:hypothetical protein
MAFSRVPLMILCVCALRCAGADFSGTWSTTWGDSTEVTKAWVAQNGNLVRGSYDHKGGEFQGYVDGNTLSGSWYQSVNKGSGTFRWTLSDDGKSFQGKWRNGTSGDWQKDAWRGVKYSTEALKYEFTRESWESFKAPAEKKWDFNIQIDSKGVSVSKKSDEESGTRKVVLKGALNFSGTWSTTWGDSTKVTKLRMRQNGNLVRGEYDFENGVFQGIVDGNVLRGSYYQSGNKSSGELEYVMSEDGQSFQGKWKTGLDGEWRPDAWRGVRYSNVPLEYEFTKESWESFKGVSRKKWSFNIKIGE